jgi:hypothetical protein
MSRLDEKTTGAVIIVMQRVHMDDLTGFPLSRSDEREVLSLPAIAEVDKDIGLGGHLPSKGRRGLVARARTPARP